MSDIQGPAKPTIINLIARFYNYDDGEILLDGKDIKSIKRNSLRKHMAFVLQDAFLFEGSIRENIRYGKLNATDDEVVEALKMPMRMTLSRNFRSNTIRQLMRMA